MVGALGVPGNDKDAFNGKDVQPNASVKVMSYDPSPKLPIVEGSVIAVEFPLVVPVHNKSPVPVPVTSIEPLSTVHDDGLVTVPVAIIGKAFTVTAVPALEADEQPDASVILTV
jgi:hypothetical protein